MFKFVKCFNRICNCSEARSLCNRQDGRTALMCAAQDGHTKVVEVLLQYGANVDLKMTVSVCSTASLLTAHALDP